MRSKRSLSNHLPDKGKQTFDKSSSLLCWMCAHLWKSMRKVSSLLKDWLSECMAMRSGIQPVSACRSMFCKEINPTERKEAINRFEVSLIESTLDWIIQTHGLTLLTVDYTYRVRAREIITTHHLHVGLFYEGNPQFVSVTWVRAEQLTIAVHWKEIINDHLKGICWCWWKVTLNQETSESK